MFWAVRANKQTILNGADPAEVLASVPDARCKAWQLKLNGKTTVDPTTLVDDTDIGPQMASEVINVKPQENFELVEDELVGKTPEQVNSMQVNALEIFVGSKHWHTDTRQRQQTTWHH